MKKGTEKLRDMPHALQPGLLTPKPEFFGFICGKKHS
jgi:hypothetical protein